jgi:5-methylcytosine-specific restriction endonuclease McrA
MSRRDAINVCDGSITQPRMEVEVTDEYPTTAKPKALRQALSKKIRFEVFKRDSFTCQYCGASAPEVVLQVDHIDPVSRGGSGEIFNLLTSCQSCNAGKGARPLSDSTALQKQKAMLDSLQERREQLEMMLEWQRSLEHLEDDTALQISDWLADLTGYRLNEKGLHKLKKWIKSFGLQEVMEAIKISKDYYLEYENQSITHVSFEKAFNSVPGICVNRRRRAEDPRLGLIQHIKAIIRKSGIYRNEAQMHDLLLQAVDAGVEEGLLFSIARQPRSWTAFKTALMNLIDEAEAEVLEVEGPAPWEQPE